VWAPSSEIAPRSQIPFALKMGVKRWFSEDLHGTTSQEMALFIATSVTTSNPAIFITIG
jgi:hypothetical protein